jgi:hypothetical protein
MWNDPIVDEVRRARDEYARALDYDLEAMFADLQQQQEKAREQGWRIIAMPPRKQDRPARSAA